MRKRRFTRIFIVIIMLGIWFVWYTKFADHYTVFHPEKVPKDFWGVTFSKKYASEIGLDWKILYRAVLDDLHARYIRLPIYWDDTERKKNIFSFSDYDWMIQEGEKRGVKFIPVIGRRLPRWPECHQPAWTSSMKDKEIDERHLYASFAAIDHFKSYKSIEYWQLENEYFFPWFGRCPKSNPELIQREISYLRAHDQRPLILTDSGELNSWRQAAKYSDILGVTMYRVVWNNYYGYFRAPWPAWLYRAKAFFAGKDAAHMMVAELQAEPWPADFQNPITVDSVEWQKSFNLKQFETNAELARRSGFQRSYLWGVEWWYWLREHGDDSMWEKAKTIMQAKNEQRS